MLEKIRRHIRDEVFLINGKEDTGDIIMVGAISLSAVMLLLLVVAIIFINPAIFLSLVFIPAVFAVAVYFLGRAVTKWLRK